MNNLKTIKERGFASPELARAQAGQSLLELTIAVGVFILIAQGLVLFVLDSYLAGRISDDFTKSSFLAAEGLEAARSVRDNSWNSLSAGTYGLAIIDNKWIFQGIEENVSLQLPNGKRIITIEDIAADQKKIISKIIWQTEGGRLQETSLFTYFTNWQAIAVCQGTCTPCSSFNNRNACRAQTGCSWSSNRCQGTCQSCSSFSSQTFCQAQSGCQWAIP
ncbi:MAG: hypothetical protein Q7T34_02945 [Candidatus Parcubacteria bacterium]|nr:hypothetical protein [Candidatus Parcubacteria bacterium]